MVTVDIEKTVSFQSERLVYLKIKTNFLHDIMLKRLNYIIIYVSYMFSGGFPFHFFDLAFAMFAENSV